MNAVESKHLLKSFIDHLGLKGVSIDVKWNPYFKFIDDDDHESFFMKLVHAHGSTPISCHGANSWCWNIHSLDAEARDIMMHYDRKMSSLNQYQFIDTSKVFSSLVELAAAKGGFFTATNVVEWYPITSFTSTEELLINLELKPSVNKSCMEW